MKYIVMATLILIAGCGEGPKHLSKPDYQHGKEAFEMLEKYESSDTESYYSAANEQIHQLSSKALDNGLLQALEDYSVALIKRDMTKEMKRYVQLELEQISKNTDLSDLAKQSHDINNRSQDLLPIIKICHDDLAGYFDATAANTNSCHEQLAAFGSKYQ